MLPPLEVMVIAPSVMFPSPLASESASMITFSLLLPDPVMALDRVISLVDARVKVLSVAAE